MYIKTVFFSYLSYSATKIQASYGIVCLCVVISVPQLSKHLADIAASWCHWRPVHLYTLPL
jgi:hypothetical protein